MSHQIDDVIQRVLRRLSVRHISRLTIGAAATLGYGAFFGALVGHFYPTLEIPVGVVSSLLFGTFLIRKATLKFPTVSDAGAKIDAALPVKNRIQSYLALASSKDRSDEAARALIASQSAKPLTSIDIPKLLPLLNSPTECGFALSVPLVWIATALLSGSILTSNNPDVVKISELVKNEQLSEPLREKLTKLADALGDKELNQSEVLEALQNAESELKEEEAKLAKSEVTSSESKELTQYEEPKVNDPKKEEEKKPEPQKSSEEKKKKEEPKSSDEEKSKEKGEAGGGEKQESNSGADEGQKQQVQKDEKKGGEEGDKGEDKGSKDSESKEQGKKDGKSKQSGGKKEGEGDGDGQGQGGSKKGGQSGQNGAQGGTEGESKDSGEKGKEPGKGGKDGGSQKEGHSGQAGKEGQNGDGKGDGKSPGGALAKVGQALQDIKEKLEGEGKDAGQKGGADSDQGNKGGDKPGKSDGKSGDSAEKNQNSGEKPDKGKTETGTGDEKGDGQKPSRPGGDKEGSESKKGRDSKGGGSSSPGDKNAPTRDLPKDGGEDEGKGVSSERAYVETRIAGGKEQVDTRFTSKEGNLALNKQEAKTKQALADVKLSKPEATTQTEEQRIPLEYRDILN